MFDNYSLIQKIFAGEHATYSSEKSIFFFLPTAAGIKLYSVIILAVAWDRLIAVEWPVGYKLINKKKCSLASFILGSAWTTCDAVFFLSNGTVDQQRNCTITGATWAGTIGPPWPLIKLTNPPAAAAEKYELG